MRGFLGLCWLATASAGAFADDHQPRNYLEYSDVFASAGQPTENHLNEIIRGGVERIVYVAYSDHKGSLEHEDRIVSDLGADFIQIPVRWDAPRPGDYALFAAVMRADPEKPTLLHCQANYRASAFAMLYRVIELGVPVADAKADMNSVWTPNETWTDYILATLESADIDPYCGGCDWTPWRPEE